MARMFPPDFDETAPSAAEKHVFNLLKADARTDDWLVLHSLGLSRRASGPYGEIDFVIIIPGQGLVCLEIKGGRVACEDGLWKTVNRFGSISVLKKSPMMQAREAMFALREKIRNHFGEGAGESHCPVGCGVVFPDVNSPPASPETASPENSSTRKNGHSNPETPAVCSTKSIPSMDSLRSTKSAASATCSSWTKSRTCAVCRHSTS